jgi:predicted transcriptional regulator
MAQGPCSIQSLETRLNANRDAIERLLQSLVSLGVCRADAMSNYALTSMGELLVDGHPRSLRGWTILATEVSRTKSRVTRKPDGSLDRNHPVALI